MNLGFKVQPPAPPRILAVPGTVACGERFDAQGGIYCERPKGHDGGHLCQSKDRYWQAGDAS